MSEPKWLELARADIGIAEIAGPKANPAIMAYYKAAGANWAKDDAVPWCGCAMAAWVTRAGLAAPAEAARARAWLDWGQPLESPRPGAVAILKRGADEKAGHVTLFLEDRGDRVLCLGGNQGDAVSITAFPKRDVLGYRWPVGAPAPVAAVKQVLVPKRPLAKSGTIWGSLTAAFGTVLLFFETVAAFCLEWVGAIGDLAPLRAAAEQAGGNIKAIGMGMTAAGAMTAISRRVKAANEGRAG